MNELIFLLMKQQDRQHDRMMYQLAIELLEKGEQTEAIEKHLSAHSGDIILIRVVIKEAKNKHDANLRKQGFRLVLIGCITGLSGFLITCINFNTTRSIDLAMYGLTSLGIIIVLRGLFKIIG